MVYVIFHRINRLNRTIKNKSMSKVIVSVLLMFVFFSCSDEPNPIQIASEAVERGAVLRTIEITNMTYDKLDLQRPIEIRLEYQDIEDGDLLENVEILISFIDTTPENGDVTSEKQLLKTLVPTDFQIGQNNLPVVDLIIETQELISLLDLTDSQLSCTDRFILDLNLNLTDGRTFNNENSTTAIRSFGGFLNSPFSYDIHVVEGIANDIFIGEYEHSSLKDGYSGPTFFLPTLVEMNATRPNVRSFEMIRIRSTDTIINKMEYTIACNQAILTRYVRTRFKCSPLVEDEHVVLLGPDLELDGSIEITDDSVFDLRFLEAFEGNDGFCDWPLTQSEVRFSKQ